MTGHKKAPGFSTGCSFREFREVYGQQGIVPPQQAAIASQQEATALMTISGEAAKAAVPEARSRRPAIVKVLFMVKSVSLI